MRGSSWRNLAPEVKNCLIGRFDPINAWTALGSMTFLSRFYLHILFYSNTFCLVSLAGRSDAWHVVLSSKAPNPHRPSRPAAATDSLNKWQLVTPQTAVWKSSSLGSLQSVATMDSVISSALPFLSSSPSTLPCRAHTDMISMFSPSGGQALRFSST